jgi:ornithine--oxo-acid transaminase
MMKASRATQSALGEDMNNQPMVSGSTAALIAAEHLYGASNYHPLPMAAHRAQGAWIWDVDGKAYLDMMSAYSAVSLGHAHPVLIDALTRQASTLAVTSRAYYNDVLPKFLADLAWATGLPKALPMNSGAEAVETAIKACRKWGEKVKGIASSSTNIIVCDNNFHGRTTTIVSFSSDAQYRDGFGPFALGFKHVPFGDAHALREAIDANTCAFIFEPIQGEAGIVLPPLGYLAEVEYICKKARVLLIADEIQTGFGRCGIPFAHRREIAQVDGLILGKALGGGLLPISVFCGSEELMGVFRPGDHGSTFGGNPLACAVARAALPLLMDPQLSERSGELGQYLLSELQRRLTGCPFLRDIRGQGLFAAIEVEAHVGARHLVEILLGLGVVSKETHGTVLRLAPPLIIDKSDVALAAARIGQAFEIYATQANLSWRAIT